MINCSLRGGNVRKKRRRETASTFRVSREVGRHELWKLNWRWIHVGKVWFIIPRTGFEQFFFFSLSFGFVWSSSLFILLSSSLMEILKLPFSLNFFLLHPGILISNWNLFFPFSFSFSFSFVYYIYREAKKFRGRYCQSILHVALTSNEIEWKLVSDENRILIVTKSFRLVIFFACLLCYLFVPSECIPSSP